MAGVVPSDRVETDIEAVRVRVRLRVRIRIQIMSCAILSPPHVSNLTGANPNLILTVGGGGYGYVT